MKIDMRDAFFEKLVELGRLDKRIIVLSADHGAFALKKFEEEMPERCINMGIAEQNMVGVAAGLAASGKIVFVYGISPFVSLRVLEQLTIDVAAMQLPVNVISVGAGFTYSTDGPTHQGLQDISAVATIPGMTILNSSDPVNTRAFVEMAVTSKKPHYIRIEKEKLPEFLPKRDVAQFLLQGYSNLNESESRVLLISTGLISHISVEIAAASKAELGIPLAVIDIHQIKPITENLLDKLKNFDHIVILEESYRSTLASELAVGILTNGLEVKLSVVDCGERYFFKGASRQEMAKESGFSKELIIDSLAKILGVE